MLLNFCDFESIIILKSFLSTKSPTLPAYQGDIYISIFVDVLLHHKLSSSRTDE